MELIYKDVKTVQYQIIYLLITYQSHQPWNGIDVQDINLSDISGTQSTNILIENNRCFDRNILGTGIKQAFGIHISDNSAGIIVRNNDVSGNNSGIAFSGRWNVSGNVIYGNYGFSTEGQGVFVGSGNASTTIYFIPHGLVQTPISGFMNVVPASLRPVVTLI